MKGKVFLLIIPAFFFLACGSNYQVIRKTPPFRFVKATLAKDVTKGKPEGETNTFSIQDNSVIANARFENLSGKHTIRWDWYAPNGKLYLSSGDYLLKTSEGRYRQRADVWHKLSIKRDKAAALPGDWRVDIFLDDEPLLSKNFIIEDDIDLLPFAQAKTDPHKWALIIGIEKYANLPPVEYAEADAQAVREYFMRVFGVPEENIISLIGHKATKAALEGHLKSYLPKNLDKDTVFYVYFAGHGAPEMKDNIHAYLVPYDGDLRFIAQSGYKLADLYDDLDKLTIKRAYVFLDACFSGNAARGNKTLLVPTLRPSLIHVEDIRLFSDKVVSLSASTGGQVSSAYPEKEHGLFTYFLLKGLKGAADKSEDEWISLGELYNYVKNNVSKISRRKGMEQIPTVAPSFDTVKGIAELKISKVPK